MLEAIFLLGRGRSFRTADNRVLIQTGQPAAALNGTVAESSGPTRIGLRITGNGTEIHVRGQSGCSAADLAATLPVQAIHTDMISVIQGPPEGRRRLVDWGVFHVEQNFLAVWRQYRRALAQRNAGLRDGFEDELLDSFEQEMAAAAEAIDQKRQHYLQRLLPPFREVGHRLLSHEIYLRYQRGWSKDVALAQLLKDSREADRTAGYTRVGPHRADFGLEIGDLSSRSRASRGQQKLLGATLVLAQTRVVTESLGRSVALLVDEPAADLDSDRLRGFMGEIQATGAQVFLGAITAENLEVGTDSAVFHVEHGTAKALL